jgi:seryl-tRNA synthetase
LPNDYLTQILQNQTKLKEAYSNIRSEKNQLQANLGRLKQQFQWGHITESEYLKEYEFIQLRLKELSPIEDQGKEIEELAKLLSDISKAWHDSNQTEKID